MEVVQLRGAQQARVQLRRRHCHHHVMQDDVRACVRDRYGHVRSESQSVQYVPFDIWTSCTHYKHIKIKVHSFKYGTSVREKINCKIIDKYLRFEYTL